MFRLIGIAVFIFVAVVGFRPIKSLLEGTATPREAVEQVRTDVAQAIATNGDDSAQQEKRAVDLSDDTAGVQPSSAASQPADDDTEAIARRLLQKANDENTN